MTFYHTPKSVFLDTMSNIRGNCAAQKNGRFTKFAFFALNLIIWVDRRSPRGSIDDLFARRFYLLRFKPLCDQIEDRRVLVVSDGTW